MMPSHLQNRMKLIEKIDNNRKYEPTKEELENAYGYLDSCFVCGNKLLPLEAFSHGFTGNCHKFGCSIPIRFVGFIYGFFSIIIRLILFIIISPFYFGWQLIKKIFGVSQDD